jgi:hypothetical protein
MLQLFFSNDDMIVEPTRSGKSNTFLWPIVVGVTTAIGLISALLGDGVWDMLSWLTLALPIALATWGLQKMRIRRL